MGKFKSPIQGYYVFCDVCGFRYKVQETKMRWDNKLVCSADWETRHPQDQLPKPRTTTYPKLLRPKPAQRLLSDVYPNGVTADDL